MQTVSMLEAVGSVASPGVMPIDGCEHSGCWGWMVSNILSLDMLFAPLLMVFTTSRLGLGSQCQAHTPFYRLFVLRPLLLVKWFRQIRCKNVLVLLGLAPTFFWGHSWLLYAPSLWSAPPARPRFEL